MGKLAWTIKCPKCGWKHQLARDILVPEKIKLTCHNCENIVVGDITQRDIFNFLNIKKESERLG